MTTKAPPAIRSGRPADRAWRRSHGWALFHGAVALLGAALVLARTWTYGTGLAWDSINYFAVARNLLAGEGFTDFDGNPTTLWPPLYPLALAAASLGVFDPAETAGLLGAAVLGATVFAVSRFLGERLESPFLRIWAPVVLAFSLPLAEFSWFARSEGLFSLLLALCLIRADRHLREGRSSDLAWAGAFGGLAWLTRYPGAVVLAAVGAFLLFRRGPALRERVRSAAVFSFLAAAPMGLWLLRNLFLIGTLTGHRRPVDYVWWKIWRDIGSVLRSWAEFDPGLGPLLGAFAAAAVTGFFLTRKSSTPPAAAPGGQGRTAALFGGFVLLYLVLLFLALMLGNSWNGIEARYLVPVYAPLLVAAAVAFDRLLLRERARPLLGRFGSLGPGVLASLLTAALSFWALGQAAPAARAVARANSPGPENGFGAEPWAGSETLRHLRERLAAAPHTYSNYPVVVYHHSDRRGTYDRLPDGLNRLAERRGAPPATPGERLAQFAAEAEDGAAILWFWNWSQETYRYSPPPALFVTPGIETVAEYADGTVFRVAREGGPPGEPVGNRFRAALEAISSGEAGEPTERAFFDLRVGEGEIRYHRDPCEKEDLRARFLLHLHPETPAALPPHREPHGFDNLDFSFFEYGVFLDGKCFALVPLPDYPIRRIRTGQWAAGEGVLWEAALRPPRPADRALRESFAAGAAGPPTVRAVFDLHLERGALAYHREPCAEGDAAAPFFLHLYPADPADLPASGSGGGFENRDFRFAEFGERLPAPVSSPEAESGEGPREATVEACLAVVPLPDYEIARLRTGQWVAGRGDLWTVEVFPDDPAAGEPR